jgi:HEAT repeat protein
MDLLEEFTMDFHRRTLADQLRAIRAAGKQRDVRVVPHLIALLQEPGKHAVTVSLAVVQALGEIGDARAAAALGRALEHGSPALSARAAAGLIAIGARAVPAVRKCLSSNTPGVRAAAARVIGAIGGARAVPLLRTLLKDHELPVRRAALEAVARFQSEEATETLGLALRDSAAEIRRRAVEALQEAEGDPEPLLCRALGDGDADVRAAAADVLLARTVPDSLLRRELEKLHVYPESRPVTSQRLICPAAVPHLVVALRHGFRPVRLRAAEFLGRIADKEPVPELRAALPDLQRLLRPWAVETDETRRLYRAVLERIEQVTRSTQSLPIPSRLSASGRDLPIQSSEPEEPEGS